MAGKNGGVRPGAGRPKGVKTRCYTVTLPLDVADRLERQASENNMTVCRYIRELIQMGGMYGNVNAPSGDVDNPGDGNVFKNATQEDWYGHS